MASIQELTPQMLARFTQIDYDREMAFVAVAGEEEIGVARYIIEPDGKRCEFALVVADARQDLGIGTLLMQALISEAKTKDLESMEGEILASNRSMPDLVHRLGFQKSVRADDPTIVQVSFKLSDYGLPEPQ